MVVASGLLALGACSKTPTFVNDLTGGGGHGAHQSSSSSSSGTGEGGGGQKTPCVVTADCGMVGRPCFEVVCQEGFCGTHAVSTGTPADAQVPGDCQRLVCDGKGGVTSVADDSDVPAHENPCTVESCTGGLLLHTAIPVGTACLPGGAATCDGSGVCMGCATDADCGAPTPCVTWTCSNALCQANLTPDGTGTPVGGVAGDCQKLVCDGKGGARLTADPTDPPLDPSPCLGATCVDGVPTALAAPAGTVCAAGVCDGLGHCGSCASDSDCGEATACGAPQCVGGHCSGIYSPAGTPVAAQTSGDCQTVVCDGLGKTKTIADDSDLPDDGDVCTKDECSGGKPVFTPLPIPDDSNPCTTDSCDPTLGVQHQAVGDGTSCGPCLYCYSGQCTDSCSGCGCDGTNCFSCGGP